MILKSLSVFATCAAFMASAGSPLVAQRTQGQNATSSKPQTQTATPGRGSSQPQQQSNRPKPWWLDDKIKKDLGLTAEQVKAIDDIYMSSKDEIASNREVTMRESKELDRLIAESKLEQWQILRQIDRMETARSNHNKTFYMMLYRMNRQLTPDQRLKLTALETQRRSGRGSDKGDPKPVR